MRRARPLGWCPMPADLTAADARRLLEGATVGPWWPSRNNGPGSVDRGKVRAFRADAPGGEFVVGEINRYVGLLEDQRLIAAAPDLAAAVIRLEEERDRLASQIRGECDANGYPAPPDGCNAAAALRHLAGCWDAEVARIWACRALAIKERDEARAKADRTANDQMQRMVDDAVCSGRAGVLLAEMTSERDAAKADIVKLTEERDKARANYQWMVDRAADRHLDGYRELGAKCAALEAERDKARAERDAAKACAENLARAALVEHGDESAAEPGWAYVEHQWVGPGLVRLTRRESGGWAWWDGAKMHRWSSALAAMKDLAAGVRP